MQCYFPTAGWLRPLLGLLLIFCATPGRTQTEYSEYLPRFANEFKSADPLPELEDYASPARFDSLYMGPYEQQVESTLDNHAALMAWSSAYYHMALNAMFRATGDIKYFEASTRMTSATLSARDDHHGLTLFTGVTAPVWGCGKYDPRGRVGHLVHSGMITYPILDMLLIARANPACAKVLGERAQPWLKQTLQSLDYFESNWTDGPGQGEGYYLSRNEETSTEGRVQSANRISAIGRSLWLAGKLTGEARYREHALAIGHYLKNRMHIDTDNDALLWVYTPEPGDIAEALPRKALNAKIKYGEDISHGALSAGLPMMLGADGEVFDHPDMLRLAHTVTRVIASPGSGVLLTDIGGNPAGKPVRSGMRMTARWLPLTAYDPAVYDALSLFLRSNIEPPEPLDIALLLLYAPAPQAK